MNYILFDDSVIRINLLPLTATRPVAQLRVGILTIAEKWQFHLQQPVSYFTQPYLQTLFPCETSRENILINGAVCPTAALCEAIRQLQSGEALVHGHWLIAARTEGEVNQAQLQPSRYRTVRAVSPDLFTVMANPWDIFVENGAQIRQDFELITRGRTSQPITDPHTIVYNPGQVFLEEGATTKAAILNAERGPIYIGKNAQVLEGAVVRGPFAMGEGAVVNVAGRMIGDNTIGPYCKVGGEVSNSILFGYSNKVHDGFIGNAVIGEWCNLGADSNNSNMKNNYGNVKLWHYGEQRLKDTGRLFCGLIMGDYSKSAIGTMFNTGTVVGVSANVFGTGQPAKFVPSFAWGGTDNTEKYRLSEALEAIERAMGRRGRTLGEAERAMLSVLYETER